MQIRAGVVKTLLTKVKHVRDFRRSVFFFFKLLNIKKKGWGFTIYQSPTNIQKAPGIYREMLECNHFAITNVQ